MNREIRVTIEVLHEDGRTLHQDVVLLDSDDVIIGDVETAIEALIETASANDDESDD